MTKYVLAAVLMLVVACHITAQAQTDGADGAYAVVISSATATDAAWRAVADSLVKKHDGQLIVYEGSVTNALPDLRALHPHYTAFVLPPGMLGRIFVATVHRMTREIDGDPYGDTIWGIVSADTPAAALRIANATEPAVVRTAITLTGVNDRLFDEKFTFSDSKAGDWWHTRDGKVLASGHDGDADRVKLFVKEFDAIQPDVLITSGHANEHNIELPFSKGDTTARGGKWYGMVRWREPVPIPPDNSHPRVFLGAGNCLVGDFKHDAESMAPTLMSAYGFNQFVGYVVPTWYGKGGWGTLGMWQQLPGRYSLAEAWFFNNQTIIHELLTKFPGQAGKKLTLSDKGEGLPDDSINNVSRDAAGMLWDRDVVAFYGDPALRVTFDPAKIPAAVTTGLKQDGDTFVLTVVNKDTGNSSVRKDQPLALWLPHRIKSATIVEGGEFDPVVTPNFIMLFKPDYAPDKTYKVVFKAAP